MTIACGRLSIMKDAPSRFSMDDMLPTNRLRDVTADLDRRFFIPFPKGSQVAKASACIIGGQGCGKSQFLNYWMHMAHERYGKENVHTIYTDDIRVALDLLNDMPVQLVIVDDAMTNASSRQVFNQTEIVKVYNRSRHVFEEKLNGKPGLILYCWAWQRFGELDPSFRQGDVMIFKTGMAEPSERKLITGFLGQWYTRILYQIWDRINCGSNYAKSTSVGCIASMNTSMGVGLYTSKMVPWIMPDMITHDMHFSDEAAEADILNKYRDDPVWGPRIQAYELVKEGKMQKEVAAIIGRRQGWVSEANAKVKTLLAKK